MRFFAEKNCSGSTCDVTRYGKLKLLLLTHFNCWILFKEPTIQRGNQCMFSEDICRDSAGKIGFNVWLDFSSRWNITQFHNQFRRYMILLNHIQPVTQVVETPSPPSPIQCCIVLWALVFINLVETFFQHCPVGEGGRHNCTDSISTKGHWLYRTEKVLITCHGIQVFDRKLRLENWQVYMVGIKCVVSQTALKFSKMERGEAKPFVYA